MSTTCANGHAVPDGSRFCPTCGLATPVAASPAPAPGAMPSTPSGMQNPTAPTAGSPTPGGPAKRTLLIAGGAVAAVVVVGLVATTVLRGGSPEPLTAATAESAFLNVSDLPMAFTTDTPSLDIEADSTFDPNTSAPCTTVLGVPRLSDLSTTLPLGASAFPVESRGITLFAGRDFTDRSDDIVSSFDERIIVFPTEELASGYLSTVGSAIEACPVATRSTVLESLSYVSVDNFRDVSVADDRVSWLSDSEGTFDSDVDFLDSTFRSEQGVTVVQRGPNVLVVDWYLDEDDRATTSEQMGTATDLAVERFVQATD